MPQFMAHEPLFDRAQIEAPDGNSLRSGIFLTLLPYYYFHLTSHHTFPSLFPILPLRLLLPPISVSTFPTCHVRPQITRDERDLVIVMPLATPRLIESRLQEVNWTKVERAWTLLLYPCLAIKPRVVKSRGKWGFISRAVLCGILSFPFQQLQCALLIGEPRKKRAFADLSSNMLLLFFWLGRLRRLLLHHLIFTRRIIVPTKHPCGLTSDTSTMELNFGFWIFYFLGATTRSGPRLFAFFSIAPIMP